MSNEIQVATSKGLFTIARGDGRWSVARADFLGDHVTLTLADPHTNTRYAALRHGHFGAKLHRSTDAGKSWEESATPQYPGKPDGVEDKDQWGKDIPWSLERVWALETGHRSQPGVLWCGTIPGGLFRSADSGDSWNLVTSLWDHPQRKNWFGGGADLPGLHSVCVDPRDGDHVTVGVSCGGVWVTRDGGGSWECKADGMLAAYMPPERTHDPTIQDPHHIVNCGAAPDRFWAQHHNGIFRSIDDCASWQEVENVPVSSFGFACAVHPQDPDTAWFVPAIKDEKRIPVDGKVVVTRTRDGGASFDVLRNGLPQEHAYDLTYRHCLDVDDSGDVLAFGSTTGTLWVTEDQGDSWKTVSKHLPPILAVRFVTG